MRGRADYKSGLKIRWLVIGAALGVVSWVSLASACSISCATEFALGPHSLLEVLVIIPVGLVVAVAFVQAVRFSLRPGEREPDHIKWRILEDSPNAE